MNPRISWLVGAIVALSSLAAGAESPDESTPSVTATIAVVGPTIVGFFPPVTQKQGDAGDGTGEGLAHLQFALTDVAKCLKSKEPSVSLELAHVLILKSGESERAFKLPKDWSRAVGAYLAAPGREPLAVYATAGPSSLQILLPNAAAEYFQEPNCKIEW